MLNNLNNENIITRTQMYEKMLPDKILGDSFAKTINCNGIHNNFCLDIPEIIEEEKRQQERRNDISKFTQMMLSDFNTVEDDKKIEELLKDESVMKTYTEDVISSLSSNNQLLNDLGLL